MFENLRSFDTQGVTIAVVLAGAILCYDGLIYFCNLKMNRLIEKLDIWILIILLLTCI